MNRNIKRLSISLVISILSALGVHYWYRSTSTFIIDYGNRQPVAQIIEVINDVQKKPLKRLVWRGLSANESIYSGEMIRTTEASQTRIIFPKTGTEINLEPDSMVMIGEDDSGLTLEFMKGFLFVKGGKDDKLNLKSGNNKIAVDGSELSLGKEETGGVQLQVFKGEPKVEGSDFQRVKDTFKVISPKPNSVVHVLPDGKDSIRFEWQKLEHNHKLILEVGKGRNQMMAVDYQSAEVANQAMALLAPGDYYWRLIAKPTDEKAEPMVSSVYRLRVLPKRPPVALNPTPESVINAPAESKEFLVPFRWANPGHLTDVVIQLAESADLRANLKTLTSGEVDFIEEKLASNKTYYWRLTGYIPETREPVSGPVLKFKIQTPTEYNPPKILSPQANANLPYTEVTQKGVVFRWQTASGADAYQIQLKTIKNQKSITLPEKPSPLTQMNLKDLAPGDYEWTVLSYDVNLKTLKPSAPYKFKVADINRIEWLNDDIENVQFYYGEQPELFANWKPGPKDTKDYRLIWRSAEADSPQQTLNSSSTSTKTTLPKDGRYLASVEAINEQGLVVAKSSEKAFLIKVAPLLDAPALASELPDPLQAGRNGRMEISWSNVDGATQYIVEIKNPKGEVVREEKINSNKTTFSKLLPGDYSVSVRGVDKAGRRGVASTERPLVVPAVSDVSAPQMKQIKVE
jgi:FecR protein